jgi:hypothetical protein
MKFTKVKIEKEILDLPEQVLNYKELVHSDYGGLKNLMNEGQIPEEILVGGEVITYTKIVVSEPGFGKRYYLVRLGDDGLLRDLVQINNDLIDEKVQIRVKNEMANFYCFEKPKIQGRAINYAISEIKLLPWYKRLFNKF